MQVVPCHRCKEYTSTTKNNSNISMGRQERAGERTGMKVVG